MKHALLSGICLVALAVAAGDAHAQYSQERWPRWYAGLNGSLAFVSDADLSGASSGKLQFDTGWGAGASLGYEPPFAGSFLNGTRFDLEYLYQENDLDSAAAVGILTAESGKLATQAVMLNAYYDISTGTRFVPYLGAGAGWANVTLDRLASAATTDDEDNAFAWQFMLGLGYEPENIPDTVWSVGYRYFATDELEYASPGGAVQVENDAHRVDVGARFRF